MMLFIWGIAAQYVLDGSSVIRTGFVITDKPKDISRQVFERLSIGITSWSVKGIFTDRKRTLIFCTVNRADVNALRAVILKAAPPRVCGRRRSAPIHRRHDALQTE